ncbi:formyltransferase family protein [Nanoarchaeota archaeon]
MKIVLLTFDSVYANIILNKVAKHLKNDKVILIKSKEYSHEHYPFFKMLAKTLRDNGVRMTCYLYLYIIFYRYLIYFTNILNKIFFRKNYPRPLNTIARKNTIKVYTKKDINSKSSLKIIKKFKPDVIFSFHYDQIIGNELLKIPKKGIVNLHYSYLPFYKGLFSNFWEIVNKEKHGGVSLFVMDKGVDTGKVIIEKKIRILPDDTLFSLNCRCSSKMGDLMVDVLEDVEKGKHLKLKKQKKVRSYFSFPHIKDIKKFKKMGRKFMSCGEYLAFFFK